MVVDAIENFLNDEEAKIKKYFGIFKKFRVYLVISFKKLSLTASLWTLKNDKCDKFKMNW